MNMFTSSRLTLEDNVEKLQSLTPSGIKQRVGRVRIYFAVRTFRNGNSRLTNALPALPGVGQRQSLFEADVSRDVKFFRRKNVLTGIDQC